MFRLLLLFWLAFAGPALAQDDPEDVDPIALAALLISDGHWDRAAVALQSADPEDKEFDAIRFHALKGLVALQTERWPEAVTEFEASIAAGQTDLMVYVQLAQARLGAEDYAGALDAAQKSGAVGEGMPGVWLLRARAHIELGDPDQAYGVLIEGHNRFPDAHEIRLHQVLLLTELGLFQEGSRLARDYLSVIGDDPEAWILVSEALRQGGDGMGAIELLEDARVRYPDTADILVQLAGTWLQEDNPLACGVLLQEASELDAVYAIESAECYRRAGAIDRALYMNAQVIDPAEKARQRLGLLLESGRYIQALSLENRLARYELHTDDKVAYAMAYARFQVGDWDGSDAWLGRIGDPAMFEHATRLRGAIERCREEPDSCI